jgi:hypothetical protein
MRKKQTLYTAIALFTLLVLFINTTFDSAAFIERRYALNEILNECTNVLFGTVTLVNQKRMTAKIRVEENIKGESQFQEIKIRFDTGVSNFPQKLLKQFEVGLPIIIFYKKVGMQIQNLGHINGTWFQTKAQDQSDKSRVWWHLKHIEIHMHRTYKGTTPDFQKQLRRILKPGTELPPESVKVQPPPPAPVGTIRVLALTGNQYNVEFPVLSEFNRIGRYSVAYQNTGDRNLPGLNGVNILWLGQSEICESEYLLMTTQEAKIRTFVKNGGVVIVSGQDSPSDQPCGTGWLPHPLKSVNGWGRSEFQPTRAAETLFSEPNLIRSGDVFIDDTWTGWNDKYTILATTNGGTELAAAMLRHGKGMYLLTSFQNETAANIFVNRPMMENLIHFAVNWLDLRLER